MTNESLLCESEDDVENNELRSGLPFDV